MCFHRTRFRNAASQSTYGRRCTQTNSSSGCFFSSKMGLYWHFLFHQQSIRHDHSTSFIYTQSDCIFRRRPLPHDMIFNMTKRWVCQHQTTYFIVHTDGTYCVPILSNKPLHNGELAFEMAFVCLWAYNMRQGSKSRCFVILQINTEQFPLEFINISDAGSSIRGHRFPCMHMWRVCLSVSCRSADFNKAISCRSCLLSVKSAVD